MSLTKFKKQVDKLDNQIYKDFLMEWKAKNFFTAEQLSLGNLQTQSGKFADLRAIVLRRMGGDTSPYRFAHVIGLIHFSRSIRGHNYWQRIYNRISYYTMNPDEFKPMNKPNLRVQAAKNRREGKKKHKPIVGGILSYTPATETVSGRDLFA